MAYLSDDMKRFNFLTAEINEAYHDAAVKLGLSDSAMLILYTVCSNGENTPISDIIHLCGISKQTVNSALRKLETESIIYLETIDGKKKKVCLTEKGKALVEQTVLKLIYIENEIFDSWTYDDRKKYVELTQKYLAQFKEKTKNLL
ncbi:MAG: winged helix-turn-helix transcriptional regulator [Faecalibacterium sp.]|nr:winged helix-turn-helix transcriptional regulator [Ruminococcus sp.]MCM1391346.1 winged helix-turn-helix transcriptional regulator [Ruminococcus sp.]MCM1484905.1 winged helix-turn-helix transcriptional regulator [Faecalibacterium sp.]